MVETEVLELQNKVRDSGCIGCSKRNSNHNTITPSTGDYMDWLRFWSKFTVEVNDTKISDVSKFHYLLELVKGKPRQDILAIGLPYNAAGYDVAKKILVENYGKDTTVRKALIKDLEDFHTIISVHKLNSIRDFYNKLSRIVRALTTLEKLETAQSAVYTLMDKGKTGD